MKSLNELRVLISTLKKYRGYATTLISLYVNAGRPMPDVVNMLRQEWAIAGNIKDKTTRTHVQSALERIINQLKGLNKAPPNGLAVFAGFHMKSPGMYDWVMYMIVPPRPISTFKYICDQVFHTEILEQMLNVGSAYGIIVIERGEAVIAILRGNYWEVAKHVEFYVPGKHHAGGQSSVRFKRQIEHLADVFYKMVAEEANKIFLNMPDLKGIIVAGPGPTKEDFLKADYLDYRLKSKVIAVVDACCANEYGVIEALKRAWKHIKDNEYVRAKRLMELITYYAIKKPDMIVYGRDKVWEAVNAGIAQTVIVSENVGEEDIMKLMLECDERNIKLEVIPSSVEESKMLEGTFGGYVAILRAPSYLIEQEMENLDLGY
ncbi:MAG: peptide chain release factor 1 [Crenarchaeota archaeon]|nr:peptide chain release factor 1 [Thermoproteota archaeon]